MTAQTSAEAEDNITPIDRTERLAGILIDRFPSLAYSDEERRAAAIATGLAPSEVDAALDILQTRQAAAAAEFNAAQQEHAHLDAEDCNRPTCQVHHGPPRITMVRDLTIEDYKPLLIDRYHPTNHTIVYGPGGVGKGTLAANDLIKLGRAGLRSVTLDYEHHPEEWKTRIHGLGGGDLPIGHWPAPTGALWDHVDQLKPMIADFQADLILIDSITFACYGAETGSGDPSAAIRYQAAVSQFGVPVVSLAHVTKENKNPEYPFGSVFWHNAPRMTYSFEFKGEQRLLKQRKSNNYEKRPPMLIETIFQQRDDGLMVPLNVYEKPYRQALIEIALEHITDPITTTGLLDAINAPLDEDDKPHDLGSLHKALQTQRRQPRAPGQTRGQRRKSKQGRRLGRDSG